MNEICLCRAGEVSDEVMTVVRSFVEAEFGSASVLPEIVPEAPAWNSTRRQYHSSDLLRAVAARRPADAMRIVGITECDLFVPVLTFVYGQAQLGGPAALVSTARLRQGFYGLPADPELEAERLRKTVLHELGHTFGLVHCEDPSCAMALATGLEQLNRKEPRLCTVCREEVRK